MFGSSSIFTVSRELPKEAIEGLMSGKFDLAGGTIRHAAGSHEAGQIFRHLIPSTPPDTFTIQAALKEVSLPGPGTRAILSNAAGKMLKGTATQATQVAGTAAQATMVISAVNLGVTVIGFAVVITMLAKQNEKLRAIGEDVEWIRSYLEAEHIAEIKVPLETLENFEQLKYSETERKRTLEIAKDKLEGFMEKNFEMMKSCKDLDQAMILQKQYQIAFVGLVRCLGELEEFDAVRVISKNCYAKWREMVTKIGREFVLGEFPARFLSEELLPDAPTSKIVSWMDFIRDEPKGVDWIDHLRPEIGRIAKDQGRTKKSKDKIKEDNINCIYSMNEIMAQNSLMLGHESQALYAAKHKVKPSVIDSFIEKEMAKLGSGECLVLEPNHL